MRNNKVKRILVGAGCLGGLIVVFLFQRQNIAGHFGWADTAASRFILNRTIRFLLNDAFAIGILYALFAERKYLIFALWVQLAGTVLFLLPYFVLKLYFPAYNGPLLSFLHRLVLNPTLLLLLIPAFYYQKRISHPSE